jgi:thiamine-phosphate pyrophosphorylase
MRNHFYKLILVTSKSNRPLPEYLSFISDCAKYGLTAVQLREKNLSDVDLLEFGKKLQKLLKPLNIPLIVNDNLKLCLELDADGVHLGQSDGNVAEARIQLGQHKIIGLTVNTLLQLKSANFLPVDYIGVGAIFPSNNKSDVFVCGLNGLKQFAYYSRHPIVAIGGINESNVKNVMRSGAYGIAAIDVFYHAVNAAVCTQNLRQIIEEIKNVSSS